MRKIVINNDFGGFSLSQKALDLYNELSKVKCNYSGDIPRDDINLVKVIKTLGEEVNGEHADLKVVEIPEDVKWFISEYDGNEHVAEKHRTWY